MRALVSLLVLFTLAYGSLAILVYVFQAKMLYLPRIAGMPEGGTPRQLGLDFETLHIPTADGLSLHAWFIPARTPRGTTLLFFHGNAGDISHRLDSIAQFNRLGLDVLIVDYRGYGQSQGTPSEAGTYEDARAAWRHLVEGRGLAPARIVLFGRSLGAAVAAKLATQVRPGALILESAFTSVPDMAAVHYWFLPVRLLSRFQYDTRASLTQTHCPLLVIHSREDEIVPFSHGQALFDGAGEPRDLLVIQGGHNDGALFSETQYLRGLDEFLTRHGL
jgi:fermentation-respiration switch protein FrsA (DUF1100 family)